MTQDTNADKRARAMSIGPHDIFLLDQWGKQLEDAFGGVTPLLVGSVARGEDTYRDVDIRIPDVLNLAQADDAGLTLRVINLAISLWGRQVTGLPIDFQMQTDEEFHSHDSELRYPMGPRTRSGWRLG